MIARVHSSILQGIDAIACEIEADVVESADNESNIRLVGLAEAAVVEGIDVIGVKYLTEAVGFLTDELPLEPVTVDLEAVFSVASKYDIDFSDVRGQETAKRALTIAAAAHHNPGAPGIGPPGSVSRLEPVAALSGLRWWNG
jgi:predicted ATPase with chaperone activity